MQNVSITVFLGIGSPFILRKADGQHSYVGSTDQTLLGQILVHLESVAPHLLGTFIQGLSFAAVLLV